MPNRHADHTVPSAIAPLGFCMLYFHVSPTSMPAKLILSVRPKSLCLSSCVCIHDCVCYHVGIQLCIALGLPCCWYFIVDCMGVIVVLIFHRLWVVSLCWYLIVYCLGFILLLVFEYVLRGFIVLLVFDCVLHGCYRLVGI